MKFLLTITGNEEADSFTKAEIAFHAPHWTAAAIMAKDYAEMLGTKGATLLTYAPKEEKKA